MGNKQQVLTDQNLKDSEVELLKFAKMPLKEIQIQKVVIDEQGNFMQTVIIGDPNLPKLVLVHGYGGSGLLLYRIFKDLSQHYNLIAIDLLGMGSSSRPPFECETGDEADNYCMVFMENWRKAMNYLTDFVLVGHSYGGYIAGTYASLYPQHIKKLILLSPLGLKFKPNGFKIENCKFEDGKAPPRCATSIYKRLWGKFTPFSYYRKISESRVRESLTGYVKKH